MDTTKTIKGLHEALGVIEAHVPERYWGYSIGAIQDAITALKDLEPVKPVYDGDCDWTACSNCGCVLDKKYGKCPECGKRIEWDG